MAEFNTPVDIANRALQLCGGKRISATLGFTENSKNASETGFVYGKLRRAALRRNFWKFAIKEAALRPIDSNTRLLNPALWVETTTYFAGCIASDENNVAWISRIPNNLGNQPENSTTWEPYFGPLTVMLYDSDTSYNSGEVVYTTAGDGTYRVYVSLQSGNDEAPDAATAWDTAAVYAANDVVSYLGTSYMSLFDLNSGQRPDLTPAAWNSGTTYTIGNTVTASDNVIYSSLGSGNTGNDPVTDAGAHWLAIGLAPWTTSFVGGAGSTKWRQIGGPEFPMGVALSELRFVYPIGSGPSDQLGSMNVYRLPAGFLRKAVQNPRTIGVTWLGGPSGITDDDWNMENDLFTTSSSGVIIFRFLADTNDVPRMDDMFCEELACDIALAICEIITQSTAKIADIRIAKKAAIDARTVDAIERGTDDLPDDPYVTVRL